LNILAPAPTGADACAQPGDDFCWAPRRPNSRVGALKLSGVEPDGTGGGRYAATGGRIMGLDDKVFAETHAEETPARNENLEGGKSSVVYPDEAEIEEKLAQKSDRATSAHCDPDEVKARADLLPEDAKHKCDLSSGDSE
jgi:hypothetical protein